MKTIDISNRLFTLTKYVSPYQYVVDVGTDHCFVPIYLKQAGIIEGAIASDVNQGPIEEAKRNIMKYGYQDSIDARCGNGLETITETDRADVIIIAGMGGKLITDILNSNTIALKTNKRLILQANVASDVVRAWLQKHDYRIIEEELILDHDIYYEIIVADRDSDVSYSQEEILFGPILLKEKGEYFMKKWQAVLEFKQSIYQKIPEDNEQRAVILAEIEIIRSILY
jgi:tRNA (adenine22-N1)-methyltransferase